MVRFSLIIKTFCLYVIWESKIKFGQKFFESPKICTPVHLWVHPTHILVRPRVHRAHRLKSAVLAHTTGAELQLLYIPRGPQQKVLHGSGRRQHDRCQAKFLTLNHVRMHSVIFYIPNTPIKLIIRA